MFLLAKRRTFYTACFAVPFDESGDNAGICMNSYQVPALPIRLKQWKSQDSPIFTPPTPPTPLCNCCCLANQTDYCCLLLIGAYFDLSSQLGMAFSSRKTPLQSPPLPPVLCCGGILSSRETCRTLRDMVNVLTSNMNMM